MKKYVYKSIAYSFSVLYEEYFSKAVYKVTSLTLLRSFTEYVIPNVKLQLLIIRINLFSG